MALFGLLMIKHFIVDLGLQQYIGPSDKHRYFSSMAHYHYAQHGLATLLVCLVVVLPVEIAILIGVVDYIIHWHIDYCKHHLNSAIGAVGHSRKWWWTNVLDQCMHTATYWIITMTVLSWPVAVHLVPAVYV